MVASLEQYSKHPVAATITNMAKREGISLEAVTESAKGRMSGMLLAAAGYLPSVAGAVAQEVIDVMAVLNALRVVLPSAELSCDGTV
jgi:cation transport ATPase